MKKGLHSVNFKFLLVLLVLGFAVSKTFSQNNSQFNINTSPLPAPTGAVNDYVGVVDAATKQRLEQKLKDFKAKNNPPIELAVAVVDTTGDRPIFDYSRSLAVGESVRRNRIIRPHFYLLRLTTANILRRSAAISKTNCPTAWSVNCKNNISFRNLKAEITAKSSKTQSTHI